MNKMVFETKDYNKFKKLKGNREVDIKRVEKIKESIKRVGYITSPIIVNEKFEVIDGQGRLEAFKELKIPVEYIIHPGIGIEECVSMNIHQTNWKQTDYIKSYAERGYASYRRLQDLIDKYPTFGISVIVTAANRIMKPNNLAIVEGRYELSEAGYLEAVKKLEIASTYIPHCKKCPGSLATLIQCIMFCSDYEEINMDRLYDKVTTLNPIMTPFTNADECFQSLELIYNRRLQNPIWIHNIYREAVRSYAPEVDKRLKNNTTHLGGIYESI